MGKKNKDDDDRHFHDFVLVQTVVSYRRGQRVRDQVLQVLLRYHQDGVGRTDGEEQGWREHAA
jgi:hypothetical protein